MIPFQPMHDDSPLLSLSPILTASLKTFAYIEANGPIGLTPSKALKRYFVEWAAEAFDWPHYGVDELYHLNRVLNEADFPPLAVLHEVWLGARLVRHFKGKLVLTKAGREMARQPAALWAVLTNWFLCEFDHAAYSRMDGEFQGNWGVILNVLNLEAQTGFTQDRCVALFTGFNEEGLSLDYHLRPMIYVHVLRPLTWAGLLVEHREGSQRLFIKTPLWGATLRLETDELLPRQTFH
jgi:hypothetical protein